MHIVAGLCPRTIREGGQVDSDKSNAEDTNLANAMEQETVRK